MGPRRLTLRVILRLIGIVAAATALAGAPAAGASDPPPEQLLLTAIPPGFVPLPPGDGNQFVDRAAAKQLAPEFGDVEGFVGGYVRTWINQETEDAITSIVFAFNIPIDPRGFLKGVAEGATQAGPDIRTFKITAFPNAVGMTGTAPIPDNPNPAHVRLVVFVTQHHAFITGYSSLAPHHSEDDAVALALAHHDSLPPIPDVTVKTNVAAVVGGLVGGLVVLAALVLLLVWLVRRRTKSGVPMEGLYNVPYAVPVGAPSGTTPPGWYPDPGGSGQQRYWDGSAWTANVTGGDTPPEL
jgi:hypothetical protein